MKGRTEDDVEEAGHFSISHCYGNWVKDEFSFNFIGINLNIKGTMANNKEQGRKLKIKLFVVFLPFSQNNSRNSSNLQKKRLPEDIRSSH